ncbi:MAG: hypothetical protein IB618_01145 [Candidatus Pacearchaeota archaeon]|nr:MAG: hypothetical protein IB618_01145 [Candidatus Pacearchaeota archaeon]
MPARKLNDEQMKELVKDVVGGNLYKQELLKKYNIGDSTFPVILKRAVKKGFISEEQRLEWIARTRTRGWNGKVKKYGLKGASDLCKEAWEKGLGKVEIDRWKEFSRLGGDTTQALYPHVRDNLRYFEVYGKNKCYYEDMEFSSFGERFVGFLLIEYGLIDKIILGENFQRKIDNKKVDFYINDKLAVEYHPTLKGHSSIECKSEEEYKEERKKHFNKGGFHGEIVVITSISDFYKKLPKLGIERIEWSTHCDRVSRVKEMLKEYDEQNLEQKVETDEYDDDECPF